MTKIEINNISTNILKEDIINNEIKESFINTNTYKHLLSSPNPKIKELITKTEGSIDTLNQSLIKFDKFINNYLDDYTNIDNNLLSVTSNNINSTPTQNALYNIEKLENIKLDNFNIPSQKLNIDYEESFKNEQTYNNLNNQSNESKIKK